MFTMRVILFGATGMIGQGVLRECLLSPSVEKVLTIGRTKSNQTHKDGKLLEIAHRDLEDYRAIEDQLVGYDACFFCLGISSAGMNEADYTKITYDYPLAAARALVKKNPHMVFLYVSGAGTDSSEKGSSMWARVKGKAENALFQIPFRAVYAFRPAFIQPLHGIRSRTKLYRILYAILTPFYPLLQAFPKYVTNTERIGRAMLAVAQKGSDKRILENAEINAAASF